MQTTNTPGSIKIAIISTKPFEGSGTIATISFSSFNGAGGITSMLASAIDSKGRPVPTEASVSEAVGIPTPGLSATPGIPFSLASTPPPAQTQQQRASVATAVNIVPAQLGTVTMPVEIPPQGTAPLPVGEGQGVVVPVQPVTESPRPPQREQPFEQAVDQPPLPNDQKTPAVSHTSIGRIIARLAPFPHR